MEHRDNVLHNLLDANLTPETSDLQGHEAERYSQYTESLKQLEDHQEKAPDDFIAQLMAALPHKPRPTWRDKVKSFLPERRFWAVPGLAGALAMLVLLTGFTLFRSSQDNDYIPVVLDLYAPSAKQVELVGTFSDWAPKTFCLKGPDAVGYWAIAIKLPPGRYEYAFLVNGSQLVPDDDGEALRPDGFGRENNVLLVRNTLKLDQKHGFAPHEYVTIPKHDSDSLILGLPDRDQWIALLDGGVSSGIERKTIENLLEHLASANITPDQARNILAPLFQDAQGRNHSEHMFFKIHECLLKKALPDTLKSMVQNRYEAFKTAKAILTQTGYGASMGEDPTLLNATAFALEGGQDPAFLREILTAGAGKPSDRIADVIEAGEILHHAGLWPETLKLIMKDALQKDLESRQMKQATKRIKERLRKGLDPKTIRDNLLG